LRNLLSGGIAPVLGPYQFVTLALAKEDTYMKRALVAYTTDSESESEAVPPPNKKRQVLFHGLACRELIGNV